MPSKTELETECDNLRARIAEIEAENETMRSRIAERESSERPPLAEIRIPFSSGTYSMPYFYVRDAMQTAERELIALSQATPDTDYSIIIQAG